MSDLVSIKIRVPVFEKLQRLAILTGDQSSAIERLIAYWEGANAPSPAPHPKDEPQPEYWQSPTGDRLRVGEILRGTDLGKPHEALVQRDGIKYGGTVYDSPSAAACAVKHARGLRGKAASTNGREFWRLRDSKTNRWIPISSLRPSHRHTTTEALAELENL
jgi:hypothetical protein